MKLYAKCPACKKDTFFPLDAITRVDLYQQKGAQWKNACTVCGAVNAYHLDDIKARQSSGKKLIYLLIGGFFIFVLLGLFLELGLIIFSAIPSYFIYHLKTEEAKKIRRFNSYRIGRDAD